MSHLLSGPAHQQHFNVSGPNRATVDFVRDTSARCIAEIGIYRGDTSEQIARPHVKVIVDLLVRRDPGYREVVADKIFRKVP